MQSRVKRRPNWLVVLAVLALFSGASWFAARSMELAKDYAQEANARKSVEALNKAEGKIASINPARGFTCDLDELRIAGWSEPQATTYAFELHCDEERGIPQSSYFVSAYPADKRARGVWGFTVVCSDQSGRVWQSLSRDEMLTSPTESEKAGKFDFRSICYRH
jgi:hypothetical protein